MPENPIKSAIAKKASRRRAVVTLVLLVGAIAWYHWGDSIREPIDRTRVRNFRYLPGSDQPVSDLRLTMGNHLHLPSGECVRVSPDVICYARSLSHHKAFGFRNGYSYVQVNGKTYGKKEGPCGSTAHLQLGEEPLDASAVVTEALIIESLKRGGFHLIH